MKTGAIRRVIHPARRRALHCCRHRSAPRRNRARPRRRHSFLDEIYATPVVRLHHHSDAFEQDELWRYAADFKTNTGKQLGVKLTRRAPGVGELELYFDPAVAMEEKIAKYVHEHLLPVAARAGCGAVAALCLPAVRHAGGQSRGVDEAAQRLAARQATAARRGERVQVPQGQGGVAEHHLRGLRAAGAALGLNSS